jgi:hypothetical protein
MSDEELRAYAQEIAKEMRPLSDQEIADLELIFSAELMEEAA